METVQLKDKTFRKSIPHAQIQASIEKIAQKLNADYNKQNPLFLVVLNGAFMFAADLMKFVKIDCSITFVKLASYEGTQSTGKHKDLIGLNEDISGRHVIIVEDIVDTGLTIDHLVSSIRLKNPASIKTCTLLLKPEALVKKDLNIDYVCMEIPNEFIVGYGLDYDGIGRNLPDIYTLHV